jgi:hypothetical protein
VARIDHSFEMGEPPAQALARFRDELSPELHRKIGFGLHKEGPSSLLYRDGLLDASPLPDAGEDLDQDLGVQGDGGRDAPYDVPSGVWASRGIFGATTRIGRLGSQDDLSDIGAHHLHVEFTPQPAGTLVHIHGHAPRDVRHAIDLLGQPGQWPQRSPE